MTRAQFFKSRIYFVAIATVAIVSLLTWNYFHGGIPRHHLFANKDLPEFSNAWGAILIPLLTWFLTALVQKRVFDKNENTERDIRPVIYAFLCSLFYAIIMATSFLFGHNEVIKTMMLAIFAIGLFFPVYRAEYFLGFVLGMTYTFGAVLPTIIASVLCVATAILYLGVRNGVLRLLRTLTQQRP